MGARQRKLVDSATGNKLKWCSKCKEWKPLTLEYFAANAGYNDGYQYNCRDCMNLYQRQLRNRKRVGSLHKHAEGQ